MPETTQLPALLRLFDDPSEQVREAVVLAFASFGDRLEAELRALEEPPGEELLASVLTSVAGRQDGNEPVPPPPPRFHIGQLVRHRRYGYRGVIVARDLSCQASDEWYQANRTRPDREQPWYHVLVHNSDATTYAAQSSLTADESAEAVRHPMVELFFHGMRDGRYLRNEQPWPPSSAGSGQDGPR